MYHGQYGIDKVIEDNYLEDFDPNGWMIECGAGDGISDSVCLHFEQEYGFRVVNIDAHPILVYELTINRPNSINLYGALGSSNDFVEFIRAEKPGVVPGGSIHYKKDYDKYLTSLGYSLTKHLTTGFTYDILIGDPVIGVGINSVELFVLDVEGHELDVIQGMNISLPKVICAEYTLCGLDELKKTLDNKGYRFDFISYNNALFSMGIPEKEWVGKTEEWSKL